jgi:hypothetical protein
MNGYEKGPDRGPSRIHRQWLVFAPTYWPVFTPTLTEDLQGSAGMYRMRNELLRMINLLVGDTLVKDVLFKEMLAY